jgi:hypothetical protein
VMEQFLWPGAHSPSFEDCLRQVHAAQAAL